MSLRSRLFVFIPKGTGDVSSHTLFGYRLPGTSRRSISFLGRFLFIELLRFRLRRIIGGSVILRSLACKSFLCERG